MATNLGSFEWPSPPAASNASVGPTGTTAPTSATEIGGINPSGNLQGANVDSNGNLIVNSGGGGSPVNSNGSQTTITNLGTSSHGFTPPTNAVGFILEAESGNTVNLRWAIVTVPTTTSGMLMEPGRDTGFIPCSGQVNVIAVSGSNQSVGIQWIMSS